MMQMDALSMLSESVRELLISFLDASNTMALSTVNKDWKQFTTQGGPCERIWHAKSDRYFGGPKGAKVPSWRIAFKVALTDARKLKQQPLQRRITWAVAAGHGNLLANMWRDEGLDSSKIENPKQILKAAAQKGHISIILWCLEVGIEVNWELIARDLVQSEMFMSLVSCLKLDLSKPETAAPLLLASLWACKPRVAQHLLSLYEYDIAPLCAQHPVQVAVESNDPEVLQVLKEYYQRLNSDDEYWREKVVETRLVKDNSTPLIWAASKSLENSVKWLLEQRADYRKSKYNGCRAIHAVCSSKTAKGSNHIIEMLLNSGDDINQFHDRMEWQMQAVDNATEYNTFYIKRTPLHFAVQAENYDVVDYLISQGADLAIGDGKPGIYYSGWRARGEKMAKERRSHVTNLCTDGTPILFSAMSRKMINYLLDKGVNPKALNKRSDTIFHSMFSTDFDLKNEEECVRLFERLLSEGVDPNDCNEDGEHAGDANISIDSMPCYVLKWLVERAKIDVNKKSKYGRTMLFSLMYPPRYNIDCVNYLISVGADVTIVDNYNVNLLYHACRSYTPHPDLISYLLKAGLQQLRPSERPMDTPLHCACSFASLEIVKMLVEAGGDIHALNENEQTPLDYARRDSEDEITAYLESKM